MGKAQVALLSRSSCPGPLELGQQRLAEHLLLLGCEAGGELDIKEDEEVPLPGGILGQWHPLTWHDLEVLRAEAGKNERKEQKFREQRPMCARYPSSQNCRDGPHYSFPVDGQVSGARTCGKRGEERLACSKYHSWKPLIKANALQADSHPGKQSRAWGWESNLPFSVTFFGTRLRRLLFCVLMKSWGGGIEARD